MLIGITGKYCAGKNHIAAIMEKEGFPVLDMDKLGYIALDNKKDEIFSRFGNEVKAADGSVNRRLLGEKVFGNKDALTALEAIVHPQVDRMAMEWIASQNGKTCVINAALLHKSALFGQLNCVFLITAPIITRMIRAKRRDKLSWISIFKRLISQKRFTLQYLAGNADIYIVENPFKEGFFPDTTGKETKTERQVRELLSELKL